MRAYFRTEFKAQSAAGDVKISLKKETGDLQFEAKPNFLKRFLITAENSL